MEDTLTKQDATFVKELVKTGNKTKSVQKAYGIKDPNYAGVKGHDLIRKPKIQKAIKSIADSISDKELIRVHKEGLNATKKENKIVGRDSDGAPEYEMVEVDDFATRHKYLDSAYKIKGTYAAEKHININFDVEKEELQKIIKGLK